MAGLVDLLHDEFDFRVVASDRDWGDDVPYAGIRPLTWTSVGPAQVIYLRPRDRRPATIGSLLREVTPQVVYLASFFSPSFSILPLFHRRLNGSRASWIVAPSGEFAPSALAIRSSKKRVFLTASRAFGLHRGVAFHATKPEEIAEIRRVNGDSAEVHLAPGLASPRAPARRRIRRPGDPLRVVFLSRIAPMKNLDFAVEVLSRVSARVDFEIYGPPEDRAYHLGCRERIGRLPENVRVREHGTVAHERVAAVLAEADLFFLPTRGENFGHAIVEALAAGAPALISDRTPWRGLAATGAGWDLPLDRPDDFVRAVEEIAAESADAWARRSAAAKALGTTFAAPSEAIEANRRMFRALAERARSV
jgi:glycosyltransferase involved in cell wall biosynthesis